MNIGKEAFEQEVKYLDDTIGVIRSKISSLGQELYDDDEKVLEFKKFIWDSKSDMDPTEMKTMMAESDLQVHLMTNKGMYLQKLFRIQNKPYFASIIFNDDNIDEEIYIGITHVEDNLNYYVHDWRSPICSLYYDHEVGNAWYKAPDGIIEGKLTRKRQYIINDAKLINVFDNNINISDELLQQVLAEESSDKMKNIVNTIQKEQNAVIRNTEDKNLIVEGIAGSGKTSVALHRIAFLLYRINNLSSSDVLIFSPNNVFTEYISNVLPELGENNTFSLTWHDFLKKNLAEYKNIENLTDFIENYYKNKPVNIDLIKYKVSDKIINDLNKYIDNLITNAKFISDLNYDGMIYLAKDELNHMFHYRYSNFPIFERIEAISNKISELNYDGKHTKSKSIAKELWKIFSVSNSYEKIYINFYDSNYSVFNDIPLIKNKTLSFEDANLLLYVKCLIKGYNTDYTVRQIVVDEAQDYTKLQYIIMKNTYRKADFTILGDVNQAIHPYYKYNCLDELLELFDESKYLRLNKTYRSTDKIIEYTNKILNLSHVSAIRNRESSEVIIRNSEDVNIILKDLNELLKNSKSIAIITKTDDETEKLYCQLKNKVNISKIDKNTSDFVRNLVIVPSYIAKGLEFDSVIVYTDISNKYKKEENNLFYVACTRAQHNLIVYNN